MEHKLLRPSASRIVELWLRLAMPSGVTVILSTCVAALASSACDIGHSLSVCRAAFFTEFIFPLVLFGALSAVTIYFGEYSDFMVSPKHPDRVAAIGSFVFATGLVAFLPVFLTIQKLDCSTFNPWCVTKLMVLEWVVVWASSYAALLISFAQTSTPPDIAVFVMVAKRNL